MSLKCALTTLVLAIALLEPSAAAAGDYIVSYAFDATTAEDYAADRTSDRNEDGTLRDCSYRVDCTITLPKSDLSISFQITGPGQRDITIHADRGGRYSPTCCYFSDGERHASRSLAQSPFRLWIFEGRPRKRNEYVQNLPLGLLYLQFSDLK